MYEVSNPGNKYLWGYSVTAWAGLVVALTHDHLMEVDELVLLDHVVTCSRQSIRSKYYHNNLHYA